MIQILLCDDDHQIRAEIEKQINNQILICQYDMQIAESTASPSVLLNHLKQIKQRQNLYFLDVELKDPEYDVFLLGQEIRLTDPEGIIVYVTSFRDLAYKTFQYHVEAFDYIVKDQPDKLSSSIARCLRDILDRMSSQSASLPGFQYFTFKAGNSLRSVPVDDICFFETSPKAHHVILHGKNQRIEFLGSLNDIAQRLNDRFMKIHRSYIVALDKIDEINLKHNTVRAGGEILSLSRKEKSKLLERMNTEGTFRKP